MRRFQVLDRNTEVFGRFFLEASAGTGKTFAIEHIAVRALLESVDPLTIDQILIVTFTKAATRELKLRLRRNLVKTLLLLQIGLDGPDYLEPIFQQGDHAIFSAQRKIEEALCHFDQASIFTLHGFCHKMLSEFAFEAGSFFDMDPVDSMAHSTQIFQVVEDFFRVGLDSSRYSPSQIAQVLSLSSSGIKGVIKRVVSWIERQVFITPTVEYSSLLVLCNKKIEEVVSRYNLDKSFFISDLEALFPLYKRIKPAHIEQGLAFFYILQSKGISYNEFDHWIGLKDSFLELLCEDNLKKGKDPKKIALHDPCLFKDICQAILPIMQQAADAELNFLRIVKDCIDKWKTSYFYQESFSPDDLLRKMVDALQKTSVQEKISKKYRIGIIDEFQDTDPLQWEIFKRIFLHPTTEGKTIYLVGDPKQSIYSFRNADVYTYLEAMDTLGPEHRLFLDTNFRSDPSLVQALNTLFTKNIARDWMPLPLAKQSLEVRAVRAKEPFPSKQEKHDRGSVHFFIAEGSLGRGKKWPSLQLEEEQIFPFIVSEMKRMHCQEGIRFGQFAILVRDRFQAGRIEDFLNTWHVPCSVKRAFVIDESIAYLAIYDLIRCVISNEDAGALKKVLGGVFIGMQAHDLIGGMELECLQSAKRFFATARQRITKKGWGAFFADFLASRWNGSLYSVEEDVLARQDPSLYFALRQRLQIIQDSPSVDLFSVGSFYIFYKNLVYLDPEDEALKVSAESEEDQVVIMTIHASKGLEFDMVFALGLVSRSVSVEEIIKTNNEGVQTLEKWDVSKTSCIDSVLESDAEKMRHLYVALTRAKNRVYIPVAIDLDRKPVELSCASSIELLCQSFTKERFDLMQAYEQIHELSAQTLADHLETISIEGSIGYSLLQDKQSHPLFPSTNDKEKNLVFLEPFSRSFASKKTLSFSAIHQKESGGASSMESIEDAVDPILPLGAETGIILHRILELVIKEDFHHPYDPEGIRQLVHEHTKVGMLAPFEDVICDRVRQTIQAPLLSNFSSFCLSDIPSTDFFLEMEFAFEIDGHMMKGFIDAIFLFDNKFYIIDWKTNYLGKDPSYYSDHKMKAVMQEQGYFLQAAIYTEALKRYLAQCDRREFSLSFGGAFYLFLRGNATYYFFPDLALLQSLPEKEASSCF